MKKDAFLLTELSIQKIPGFPRGMESCKDLAANINIIAGPNASGKSSTAATIKKLIWRNDTRGISAECSVKIGASPWEIKIDSGTCLLQCDGKDDVFTGLPAFEESGRYMLALHELFQEEDKELAKQIIKESMGGYDLEVAQQKLHYSIGINNRNVSEFKSFRASEEKRKEIEKKQKGLRKEEDRLGHLSQERERAHEASRLVTFYEQVIQYLEAKLNFDQISEEYKAFPTILHKVTGEEYGAIGDLEEEIKDIKQDVEASKNKIEASKKAILSLNLPDEGVPEEVLSELEERVENINELDQQIVNLDKETRGFEVKEREALNSIDQNSDASGWENINLKDVYDLDEFLQKAHGILSEKRFLETEIKELSKEETGELVKTEEISEGIRALSYWLEGNVATGGISWGLFMMVFVVAILTAVITYYIGWPGLSGILIIIVIAVYAFTKKPANSRIFREQDYIRTGLSQPDSWNGEKVTLKIEELTAALNEAKWQETIQQKKVAAGNELEALSERLDEINRVHDEWLEKLQNTPRLPQGDLKTYSGLAWFLNYVKEWQRNNSEIQALKEKKILVSAEKEATLEKINRLFAESNVAVAHDGISAKVILKKLSQELKNRQAYLDEIAWQNENVTDKIHQKDRLIEKLKSIYDKLETSFGQKEEIRLLTVQLETYQKVKVGCQVSEKSLSEQKRRLEAHSLYESQMEALNTLTSDQAAEKETRLGYACG